MPRDTYGIDAEPLAWMRVTLSHALTGVQDNRSRGTRRSTGRSRQAHGLLWQRCKPSVDEELSVRITACGTITPDLHERFRIVPCPLLEVSPLGKAAEAGKLRSCRDSVGYNDQYVAALFGK